MKKIILLCLAAISLCQAADPRSYDLLFHIYDDTKDYPYASWHEAVQDIPIWQNQDWQNAHELRLSGRNITALPENFNFPQLEHLDLNNNELTALPANFNPPQLISLDLDNNQLVALPENFNPPNLRSLYLDNNNLTALPENFNPPLLTRLELNGNLISDKEINQMIERFKDQGYLPNLRELNLSGNPITQNAISELKRVLREKNRPTLINASWLTGDSIRNVKRAK